MKKLPIGVSDFEKLIKGNYYYVDKSMLIKDVLDLPGDVKLITRPRRFGKTLNIDTLRRFFDMNQKENLLEGLRIWREKGIVKDYYHKHPVIFVSFKGVKEVNWKTAMEKMKRLLAEIVADHEEFIQKRSDRLYAEGIIEKKAEEGEYSEVLRFLCKVLHEATGRKVIVLVDEYDVPIEAAYTYRHKDSDYYDEMVVFMRGLLTSALKDNEHLEFGVLTGVYRVAKESIFSGLNNLAVYTIFENEMADKFGFTEEEVTEMLSHYGLSDQDRRVVMEWYGGYTAGNEELYNPWSVLNYVSSRLSGNDPERAAQPFWINTSSNDLIVEQIHKNPDLQEEIDKLLRGEEIEKILETNLSLRELETKPSGVWVLLASSGYVSARYLEGGNVYSLRIPNEELMRFFKNCVLEWIETKKLESGYRRCWKGCD